MLIFLDPEFAEKGMHSLKVDETWAFLGCGQSRIQQHVSLALGWHVKNAQIMDDLRKPHGWVYAFFDMPS